MINAGIPAANIQASAFSFEMTGASSNTPARKNTVKMPSATSASLVAAFTATTRDAVIRLGQQHPGVAFLAGVNIELLRQP